MNLSERFNSLRPPESSNKALLNVLTLEEFPFARIALNSEGFPLLIISLPPNNSESTRNIRLKYLELTYNVGCKLTENGKSTFETVTTILFKSDQNTLQHYFLNVAETFIKSIAEHFSQTEIFRTFKSLIEIFRALSETPNKTVQGLWSELFIINSSKNPTSLLSYWHNIPEEKFDFNADTERLEVKSSSIFERKHNFASEQLNPPVGKRVLIASIFSKQTGHGQSIEQLAYSIQLKVTDPYLIQKLYTVISRTLGSAIEQALKIKFDVEIATNSLKFYDHKDIQRIEQVHIPNQVTDVRYKSDLSFSLETQLPTLERKGILFEAL